MGTLDRAAECLVQLTRMGLGAVQAGGQVVTTLWDRDQVTCLSTWSSCGTSWTVNIGEGTLCTTLAQGP